LLIMHYLPFNPVVQLCVKGIGTEYGGAPEQADAGEALKWNLLALEYARKVDAAEVTSFLPSLYLNVAKSYEDLKDFGNARV
ncbi:MAG: hypothetical protein ABUL46_03465, partial [Chitinophaga rupis]